MDKIPLNPVFSRLTLPGLSDAPHITDAPVPLLSLWSSAGASMSMFLL